MVNPNTLPGNYLFAVATQYLTVAMHDLPVFYLYMQLIHTLERGFKVAELLFVSHIH